MRPQILHLLVLCSILVVACAWTKEDHEIFRLRDEVEEAEGQGVTFYDFLGVKPSASYDEIQKAFRKKSRALHPDKVKPSFIALRSTGKPKAGQKKKAHVSKGPSQREIQAFTKKATARYSRLGVVANVLKGGARERYDHFLQNGFPTWRGTGYYYTRFRPGLGSVLIGLFIAGGGFAHYGALVLGWKRQRSFMERYIRQARKSAWGDETGIRGIPGLNGSTAYSAPSPVEEEADAMANLNRRQKREMERQNKKETKSGKAKAAKPAETMPTVTPSGSKKRVVAENGKMLVVDSVGNVFLEEEDEEGIVAEFLLDIDEIPRPTFRDTAVYKLPIWLYRKAADPFLKKLPPGPSDVSEKEAETAEKEMEIAVQHRMESSQESVEGFEMVEAAGTGTEDMGKTKKRGKKGKK